MKNKVELLAPAGDWESFLAAVENGADAVYLGGKLFNARQFAGNFDAENLKRALDYAHVRGVNLYLTMNTLLLDSEIKQAVDFVEEAYVMGIDGVIVQDIGFAMLLRNLFPNLSLHASTQMTIYNVNGVKVLEQLGFKRAVLARELTVEEISFIAKNSSLEIEIFGHGALCICYSGQCLMSSIIGGRSGNRGKCAQPCRLPYELVSETEKNPSVKGMGKYLLSPKDLCSISEQTRLVQLGIRSIKIEGRMKSPEYVAKVVQTYRKQLDSIFHAEDQLNTKKPPASSKDLKELAQIFNRGGFTTGYLNGKLGKDMMCFEKPKNWGVYLGAVISYQRNTEMVKILLAEDVAMGDGFEVWNDEGESPGTVISEIRLMGKNIPSAVAGQVVEIGHVRGRILEGHPVYKTSDKKLNATARDTFTGRSLKKVGLECRVIIKKGEPISFFVNDELGNKTEAVGEILPEVAVNKALTKERVEEQLGKTGATPFEFSKIDLELEEGLSLTVSEINQVRRRALEDMEYSRAVKHRRIMSQEAMEMKEKLLHFPGNSRNTSEDVKLTALFYGIEEPLNYSQLGLDRIYLCYTRFLEKNSREIVEACKEVNCEVYAWLPSITRGNHDHLIKSKLESVVETGIDGILLGNLGLLTLQEDFPELSFGCDSSINALNSFTMNELGKMGIKNQTLSLELNLNQMSHLQMDAAITKEAVVYGRIPVMSSEYCPVGCVVGGYKEGAKCSMPCNKGLYKLKDRMGMKFPVLCDKIDCRSTVFNSNVLFLLDSLDKFKKAGMNRVRLNFTEEKPTEIKEIIEAYRDVLCYGTKVVDRYKNLTDRIREQGFTKGHYFRGV